MTMKKIILTGALVGTAALGSLASAQGVDADMPEYSRASGVSGNLSSVGSDTLNNLMTLWAEEFNRLYPNVNIQIQGAGSSTAPPALTQGASNVGPMSRAMRDSEIEEFENAYGYPPVQIPVAVDLLAVYVNRDNPIEGMSLPEVDAVFSETRRGNHPESIETWGQLGLEGAWENRDIAMYGRNAVSGTYGYFKDNALFGGDFRASVNEQPGSSSVVQGVTESINGIGYSGIGYNTSGVRTVPLSAETGGEYAEASADNALNGTYPLARFLYVYVNKNPNEELDPMMKEFMSMILSRQGQEVVVRDGFVPLPASVAQDIRAELGID